MTEDSSRLTPSEDRSTERISTEVVTAVAETTGTDPTDLPPLYHVIDPDALDELFRSQFPGRASTTGQVTFSMAGCDVVVDSSGQVAVTPVESDDGSGLEE